MCAALVLLLQSSSGAASTLERLTKETDANISQVHADVAAKKNLVRPAAARLRVVSACRIASSCACVFVDQQPGAC